MKFKLITLAFTVLISAYGYSDNIFLTGGFVLTPETQVTAFDSRPVKIQPGLNTGGFFHINFGRFFAAGLSADYLYTLSSDLNGGWSYPGFSGLEAGLDLRFGMPFLPPAGIGISGYAGWYRYNLTENHFFLPSASIYPSLLISDGDRLALYAELPFRYYFHRQADIFLSAGLRIRAVLK